MKKFFLALLLAASVACMAASVAFADDSGFTAGGGSANPGSGVGRNDIATSETASGIGRDEVLAFGGDMKDTVDKYGGGLSDGIDYVKDMWDKCFTGIADYAAFFAEGYADVYWNDPVLLLYLVVLIVGLVTIGVVRALTM